MARRIYLDHAATTPMRPEAIAAVEEGMRRWANPSSPHAEGRAARAALEEARARIKTALDWDGELIFTSGASEALAIGLGRAKAGRRIVSAVEHDAVFRAAPGAAVLPVDRSGNFDADWLRDRLFEGERPVVAIQSVNSETGQAQDLMLAESIVREGGGVLLSDCAQSAGKYPLPRVDMAIVSAHKLGGPPGVGALLLRDFGLIEPVGGQEYGYRAGTENLPGALGFAAALEAPSPGMNLETELGMAVQRLHKAIGPAGGAPVMGYGSLSAWIKAIAMPGLSAAAQLMRFDMKGFAVSAGSACSSGTLKPSRVLAAFGIDPEVAARTIRVSFGWNTTAEEIDAFRECWVAMAGEAGERAA